MPNEINPSPTHQGTGENEAVNREHSFTQAKSNLGDCRYRVS